MLIVKEVQSEEFFENLVIEIKGDTTNAYIVKYTPNIDSPTLDEHGHGDFEGTIEASKVYGQTCIICTDQQPNENGVVTGPNEAGGGPPTICITLYKCYKPDAAFPNLSIPHLSYSGGCQQMPFPICGAFGFGSTSLTGLGTGPGNPNAGPNGGLGSGGNNTSNTSNPIVVPVAPTIKTPTQIKLEFETTLNPEQIAWLNNPLNNDLEYEIIKYLTDNQTFTDVETANSTFVFAQQTIAQIMLNPILFTSIKPFLIEKQIDDSELDDCTKGILDDLKNLQQQDIAKIFAKLNNPVMIVKPQYNTKIVIENPTYINALADSNYLAVPMSGPQPGIAVQSNFNYVIRIRPAYLNGTMLSNSITPTKPTKLSIARTVLHEIIHVYLNSLYNDCEYGINCIEIKSFEDLWQDYMIDQNGGTNPDDAQHLTFAKNFTNILARALQEYQTGVAVSDSVEPNQDYKDLAWFGLLGNYPASPPDSMAQIFNLEYPLGSEKRERFEKVNDAENIQQSSSVNGLLITPKNTPCN